MPQTRSRTNAPRLDRETFVRAMRNVASSVMVVTTNGPAGRHGATVSAFCSVSADPPTVLVCLHKSSRIAQHVSTNGVFNVNVLPLGAGMLAERFAGLHDADVIDRFDGIDLREGFVPSFPGATVLQCRMTQSVPSGSHLVCFGSVSAVQNEQANPLAYLDGAFHRVTPLAAAE